MKEFKRNGLIFTTNLGNGYEIQYFPGFSWPPEGECTALVKDGEYLHKVKGVKVKEFGSWWDYGEGDIEKSLKAFNTWCPFN